jgi:hypothetical protein
MILFARSAGRMRDADAELRLNTFDFPAVHANG